jgi:hypothetical protein
MKCCEGSEETADSAMNILGSEVGYLLATSYHRFIRVLGL